MLQKIIRFLIDNKPIPILVLLVVFLIGITVVPIKRPDFLPDLSVNIDAIPDIGENQQILFTEWAGKSPQDVEDQITFPLTSSILGIPKVKSIRSSSMFGYSSIYIIFEDDAEYYWSRTRILEKINALPANLLPQGVQPKLGPDATSLGQVFWYTLEGHDEKGKVVGGWSLQELRSIQDFYVKYALGGTQGVAEVASVGGFVKQYQIDVDPERMRQYGVSLKQIVNAVKTSNKDIGAQTIEINRAEYFVRGLGYVQSIQDIENTAILANGFTPIRIKDVAIVKMGPAERRGILDKNGSEVVGGVVTARYGENPLKVIQAIEQKIEQTLPGLPQKTLQDGTVSQVRIVPFYDRSELISDNLKTLGSSLLFEVLFVVLVMVVMLRSLKLSLLISSLMPFVVLSVFVAMKIFSIDANIVALSGIAIAIGTVVDMGIILAENIKRHKKQNDYESVSVSVSEVVLKASKEVSGAILTAGFTTVVSFTPIFLMTGAEGKMFFPLAFTKTIALFSAMLLTVFVMPAVYVALSKRGKIKNLVTNKIYGVSLVLLGLFFGSFYNVTALFLIGYGAIEFLFGIEKINEIEKTKVNRIYTVLIIIILLSIFWRPLGFDNTLFTNVLFVAFLCFLVIYPIIWFIKYYEQMLEWVLKYKNRVVVVPIVLIGIGFGIMLTMDREFMPSLNEGDFLLMPTSLPHSGISEVSDVLKKMDIAVASIPEVEYVVGKAGRVESPLDPAPLSMYENLISYKPEYILDKVGKPIRFKTDGNGGFITKKKDTISFGTNVHSLNLIEDNGGEYYRNWRSHIKSIDDIWNEITKKSKLPGVTAAPKLQPIETRLVMLQTGMRSNLGIKVKGQDLNDVYKFSLKLENILKSTDGLIPETIFAERLVGKPYLLIDLDRNAISRYGLSIETVQNSIETAVGGRTISQTIEGRERYDMRIRYPRELRNSPGELESIYIDLPDKGQINLGELAAITYQKGPQNIKSEDGFLVNYVIFDKDENISEIDAVDHARRAIENALQSEELIVPNGVSFEFSGTYKNYLHSQKTLSFIVPLVLIVILLILYLQFRSLSTSLMVFTGITMAFAGGFILVWLFGQDWFLNIDGLREELNISRINLSVAVWVGFIALFGIATDDGVVMATYLDQTFKNERPSSVDEIRKAVILAGKKRILPCLMTSVTTILALIPIIISTGKGSEIMMPMAIPCLGGMLMTTMTLFVLPLLYCWRKEVLLRKAIE